MTPVPHSCIRTWSILCTASMRCSVLLSSLRFILLGLVLEDNTQANLLGLKQLFLGYDGEVGGGERLATKEAFVKHVGEWLERCLEERERGDGEDDGRIRGELSIDRNVICCGRLKCRCGRSLLGRWLWRRDGSQ